MTESHDASAETWQFHITSTSLPGADVLRQFEALGSLSTGSLSLQKPKLQFRAVDAAIIIAVIGATGPALTALVAGLLKVFESKKGQSISIELASGAKIVVPVETSAEDLKKIIEPVVAEAPRKIILP
jgi:hypothetical protein